jgi:hypothetical protein
LTDNITALIIRRRRQFLVHSFLYYMLDESIIDDTTYDRWCVELVNLQRKHPDLAASLPYHDICSQLDESASGSYIKNYPPEIVSTAFHLLAREKQQPLAELVQRYGYQLVDYS